MAFTIPRCGFVVGWNTESTTWKRTSNISFTSKTSTREVERTVFDHVDHFDLLCDRLCD